MEENWVVVRKEKSSSNPDFIDFDFTTVIIPLVIALGMIAVLTPLAQQMQSQTQMLQAQAYHGTEDPRTVHVTNNLSWINLIYNYPFRSWISAYFINDGPSSVEVGINYPDDRFLIKPNETITVNRTGALDEKINVIFFICHPGLKATVRVIGTF